MTRLVALFVLGLAAAPLQAQEQAAGAAAQARVAETLLGEMRSRLGSEATVSLGRIEVMARGDLRGSIAVALAPQARLGDELTFIIVGAGPSGKPMQVGRGRAQVFVSVPHAQASRTLARGAVLTADDLIDITGEPSGAPVRRLPTTKDLVGATLRRDVVNGDVLTLQEAVLPPAVRAGDTVQAIAAIGPVQVSAELTALDNGAAGTLVRVVNRETRRELRARVVRPGVVEVIHD